MTSKKGWQRSEIGYRIQTVAVRSNNWKPFTHALALGFYFRVLTEGSCKRLFYCSHGHSDTMRYVSGSVLNNPVTRASQSGEGGPRIEPGGKAVRSLSLSSDYAKTWLQRVMYASTERTVVIEHGKAVLCSSIHQRVIHTRGYQRDT